MYARNQFLRRFFRSGGADCGTGSGSCQDPGSGGGIVWSPGAVDGDLEETLSVTTFGRSGWVGLRAAGAPRGREVSDILTAVSSDSAEAEVLSNSVLLPRLGLLASGFVSSG